MILGSPKPFSDLPTGNADERSKGATKNWICSSFLFFFFPRDASEKFVTGSRKKKKSEWLARDFAAFGEKEGRESAFCSPPVTYFVVI